MGFLSDMRRTSASLQAIASLANAQHPVEQGGNNGVSLPYHVPRGANISALGLFVQRQLSHNFAKLFASTMHAPAMGEFVVDEVMSPHTKRLSDARGTRHLVRYCSSSKALRLTFIKSERV